MLLGSTAKIDFSSYAAERGEWTSREMANIQWVYFIGTNLKKKFLTLDEEHKV